MGKRRQQIASRYQKLLKDIQEIELPKCDLNEDMLHSWNQFVVKIKDTDLINIKIKESPIKFEKNSTIDLPDASFRDWFKEGLSQMGVGTIIYYPIPIHKQPIYKELGYQDCNLPNTEQLSSSVLSLPIFPELTISQQDYVIDSIKKLLDY